MRCSTTSAPASQADRSQFFKDLSDRLLRRQPAGREGLAGPARFVLAAGHAGRAQGGLDCIKAFSETDFTEDLKKFDVPTLILHGDDDQIVPIGARGDALVEAGQGRDAEGLPGRAARYVLDAQASGECGSDRVHSRLTVEAQPMFLRR